MPGPAQAMIQALQRRWLARDVHCLVAQFLCGCVAPGLTWLLPPEPSRVVQPWLIPVVIDCIMLRGAVIPHGNIVLAPSPANGIVQPCDTALQQVEHAGRFTA